MVGPSMTDDERDLANSQLSIGFVVLVGLSGGLVAFQAGGGLVQIGAAVAGGLVLGYVLLWFLSRLASELAMSGGKRGPRR